MITQSTLSAVHVTHINTQTQAICANHANYAILRELHFGMKKIGRMAMGKTQDKPGFA
jgi:hypothetical protein